MFYAGFQISRKHVLRSSVISKFYHSLCSNTFQLSDTLQCYTSFHLDKHFTVITSATLNPQQKFNLNQLDTFLWFSGNFNLKERRAAVVVLLTKNSSPSSLLVSYCPYMDVGFHKFIPFFYNPAAAHCQLVPAILDGLMLLSCHLFCGRFASGLHSITVLVQHSSVLLTMCGPRSIPIMLSVPATTYICFLIR